MFNLPVARLFSDRALRGIAAHELAHAVRAARLGPGWYDTMDANYDREERAADRIATR
jgi:hypothetical protein